MARPRAAAAATTTANGVLISISALLSVFYKHAGRFTRKLKADSTSARHGQSPKKLLNQSDTFDYKKRSNDIEVDDEFGDGGVWQRSIILGEKCQPPDFSGVIYYDPKGNQISELPPRSPRIGPTPGLFRV